MAAGFTLMTTLGAMLAGWWPFFHTFFVIKASDYMWAGILLLPSVVSSALLVVVFLAPRRSATVAPMVAILGGLQIFLVLGWPVTPEAWMGASSGMMTRDGTAVIAICWLVFLSLLGAGLLWRARARPTQLAWLKVAAVLVGSILAGGGVVAYAVGQTQFDMCDSTSTSFSPPIPEVVRGNPQIRLGDKEVLSYQPQNAIVVATNTVITIVSPCQGQLQSIKSSLGDATTTLASGRVYASSGIFVAHRSTYYAVLLAVRPGIETIQFNALYGEARCAPPRPLTIIVTGDGLTSAMAPALAVVNRLLQLAYDGYPYGGHWPACAQFGESNCPLADALTARLTQLKNENYLTVACKGENYLMGAPVALSSPSEFTLNQRANGDVAVVIQRGVRPALTVVATQVGNAWLVLDLASGDGPMASVFSSAPNC